MNSSDHQACLDSLNNLTSTKYQNKNLLFLAPVDRNEVPGYDKVITRPMDLGTVRTKLEENKYESPTAFWMDVDLVFTNAVTYNKDRKETQFVVKLAKDMMKLVNKERRKVKPKATGLKLKLSAPKKTMGDNSSSGSSKTKVKLKQPLADNAATGKTKANKPKLKLTLSMNKSNPKKAKSPSPPPLPTSSQSSPTKQPTQKVRQITQNRGKELPKGVSSTPPSKPSGGIVSPTTSTNNSSKSSSSSRTNASKSTATKTSTGKGAAGKASIKTSITKSVTPKANNAKASGKGKKQSTANKSKSEAKTGRNKKLTLPKAGSLSTASSTSNGMTPQRKEQCMKVLSGLKRRKHKNVTWFTAPVSDKAIVDDYKLKIPNPMDIGTMMNKLEKDSYQTVTQFVLDLRRVFGNCLRYNTTKQDSLRPVAVDMLKTAEELMAYFIAKPESSSQIYPSLLYCWGVCIDLIDRLLNVTNPSDGHQTAHFFLHPASTFFVGGNLPADYKSKISRPMDFGTITSNLIEGNYQSVAVFTADCRLVIENCLNYYGGREDGKEFTQQANHLKALMGQQLDALTRYDQSQNANQARSNAVSWQNVHFPKPQANLLLGILNDLREVRYTDRLTKLSQPAMRPFEKAVDLTVYRDYLQYVQTPMDLETIERKVKAGSYETPEDFEYDVHLIFRNCEAYNAPRKTDQMVAMGKNGAKEFRKLFIKRMKAYENPDESRKHAISPPSNPNKLKRVKTEDSAEVAKQPKSAPTRINITASKSKSPVPTGKKAKEAENNAPVPLHVAIAEVKARYPLRRQLKFLEPWEAACAKFFKELMKHPWISVARPKFIYHVPVSKVFPELKQAYLLKVKNPMDLTTAEAKLHCGRYKEAQGFVDDVALVFANAIAFNKDGRDIGDHISIAYYDASIHLLKYTRWLSLEHLQKYLSKDDHIDEAMPDELPPSSWKLTTGNRKKSREEMANIVMNEEIEKSMEGDRFPATWMESETEKLLKALRHQSDSKKMGFFIEPNYPPDYTAFISKPMDWQRVQKTLKKRNYVKFGEVIDDLRLIFSNALKYNAKRKLMSLYSFSFFSFQ